MKDKVTKSQLNINVNKDDDSINDYLYCWNKFDSRPHRVKLHASYDYGKFSEFISKFESDSKFTEIIPASDEYIINEKSLIKFTDGIFISLTHYDKEMEDSIVGDVEIFYKKGEETTVEEIVNTLSDFELDFSEENSIQRINTINISQSGLDIESFELLKSDYENIDLYFNDDVLKKTDKLTKIIKKTQKGLSIIWGERGNGKTTLVNWIASNLDKVVIFVPSTLVEMTINNPDFRTILKRYKNCVLIIDDSEIYLSDIYSKSNIFTNNLLQLIDGFQSDAFNLNVILVCNCHISDIDTDISDSNNFLDAIEVSPLSKEKASELVKTTDRKIKVKSSMKVVDVLKKRSVSSNEIQMGFN